MSPHPHRPVIIFANGIDQVFIQCVDVADQPEKPAPDSDQPASLVARPCISLPVLIRKLHAVAGQPVARGQSLKCAVFLYTNQTKVSDAGPYAAFSVSVRKAQ